MKFSEKWLREWVNPDLETEQLAHQLTMAGLEVDAIEPVVPDHSGVVVGQIVGASKHPDADKLQVCRVDVGSLSDEPLQIVCGAANARTGIKVACAMIKAVLPGNFRIKKSKLRGVQSFGMLCSASELGLTDSSNGIMELPDDAPLGMSLFDYFGWDDQIIEIGLTPNRSDCLSIEGIAREVAVITGSDILQSVSPQIPAVTDKQLVVDLQAVEHCPRYLCRVISDIDMGVATPLWMSEKLCRSGIRSINAIVDITNYVMLELGQPMHAFDASKIHGSIQVRLAQAGETLVLLNDQEVTMDGQTLVIADDNQALALAGIMGGRDSAVDVQTQSIVLESAYFVPEKIAGKARSYGLHTDSSHRFERGVSAKLQRRAIERATQLIIEICGGQPGTIVEKQQSEYLPKQGTSASAIRFQPRIIDSLLGISLQPDYISKILTRLQMQVERNEDYWLVTPPDFRFDIKLDVDLVEEVARIYGYDNLPVKSISSVAKMPALPENRLSEIQIKRTMVALDYHEVINYSFVDPKVQQLLEPEQKTLSLSNPISEDLSQMRVSLWTGLCQSLVYNQNRQQSRIRLFESGTRFVFDDQDNLQQQAVFAAISSGSCYPEQWGADKLGDSRDRAVDFYDMKSDLENILALGGQGAYYRFVREKHPALHPGQSARIYKGNRAVGWIGALHPKLMKTLQIKSQAFVFEVELDTILEARLPQFEILSKYPAIRRDIAIIVDAHVETAQIIATIKEHMGENLIEVFLFDVYTGSTVDNNKKSLAIALNLQNKQRTLQVDEVDQAIDNLLQVLEKEYQARLRD